MLPCHFKSAFGMDCPGCGAQRSFLELINGDIIHSFILFPALLPLIFTLFYTVLHLVINFKNGARVIVVSFSITVTTIVISFVYKQIIYFNNL